MGAVFTVFAEYIRDFIDDAEVTDNVVATWVAMAEERFNNELRCAEMVKRARLTLSDQCTPLPDDFLEMIGLTYSSNGLPLRYVSVDAYNRMRSEAEFYLSGPQTTAITYLDPNTGQPLGPLPRQPAFIDYGSRGPSRLPQASNSFTLIGHTLFVHPTITISPATEVELSYYAKVPSLYDWDVELTPKPPLLQRAPKLYAFGTLAASAPYLVEDDRAQMWDTNVTAMIQKMNEASHLSKVVSSPMRVQVRTFG